MQGGRDVSWASGRSRSPSPGRLIRELDQCPRQLLDEQRHAVGPGDDLPADRLGQRLASLDSGVIASTAARPSRLRTRRVTWGWPARIGLAVRPARQQHEDAPVLDPVQHQLHELESRGIDPVHVLDHHQHRPAAREADQLVDQRRERPAAALLWREIERAVALVARRSPSRSAISGAALVDSPGSRRSRPRSCRAASRVRSSARKPAATVSCWIDRPQRAVDMIGRAL